MDGLGQLDGTPINQTLINDLAGGFIAQQRNAVLVGGTGTQHDPASHCHCQKLRPIRRPRRGLGLNALVASAEAAPGRKSVFPRNSALRWAHNRLDRVEIPR